MIHIEQKIIIFGIFLILFFNTSCESFLSENEIPRPTIEYYKTAAGVKAATTAVYAYMRWMPGNIAAMGLNEHGIDLFTQAEGSDGLFNTYGTRLSPSTGVLYEMWSNHYRAINTANLVLQTIDEGNMSDKEKIGGKAEMSFLRAYFYFDLVQQFGRIPLVLDASFDVRTNFQRASVAEIYNRIIEDLTFAESNLPEVANEGTHTIGRATKYAAAHLLAKVLITRSSAITEDRGQQPTDCQTALAYAEKVINSGKYTLETDFAQLWDINNQNNKEVLFAVQFTTDPQYNGSGNRLHLMFGSWYEDQPGMVRDLENGRPYRYFRATNKTMLELFDRKNDSRFYKSFKWVYYCNKEVKDQKTNETILSVGDTAIYYSLNPQRYPTKYSYFQWNKEEPKKNNRYYPPLIKYFDSQRQSYNDESGTRDWVRMRLGETYLLAAEAAGRSGDFELAAKYINVLRKRAAWHDGEKKYPQYWLEEGGVPDDEHSTYEQIKLKATDISINFVDFILDERGRELLGEYNRWEDLVRCEKLLEYTKKYNPDAINIRDFHKLRPIPQNHIDRLNPRGTDVEEQNPGYY